MHQRCQTGGATGAVVSEGLRSLSPSMGRMRWTGRERWFFSTAARLFQDTSSNRNCTRGRWTVRRLRPGSSSSLCVCSSLHSPLRLLMFGRRQDNDWTRLRRDPGTTGKWDKLNLQSLRGQPRSGDRFQTELQPASLQRSTRRS